MRIRSRDQVTIPKEVRGRAGLLPHTEVEFVVEGDAVRIVKAAAGRPKGRGQMLIAGLRGKGTIPLSTDEIMALTRGEP